METQSCSTAHPNTPSEQCWSSTASPCIPNHFSWYFSALHSSSAGVPSIHMQLEHPGVAPGLQEAQPRTQDSPFWVSLVEQMTVEIWKLSRADTVRPDAPLLTRKEEPERSLGSDGLRTEGRAR